MPGARESRRLDRQRGRGPGSSFTHRLIQGPPSDPPEGHVDPQSWPLPPGQACAAPRTRHKWELTPSESPVGFSEP